MHNLRYQTKCFCRLANCSRACLPVLVAYLIYRQRSGWCKESGIGKRRTLRHEWLLKRPAFLEKHDISFKRHRCRKQPRFRVVFYFPSFFCRAPTFPWLASRFFHLTDIETTCRAKQVLVYFRNRTKTCQSQLPVLVAKIWVSHSPETASSAGNRIIGVCLIFMIRDSVRLVLSGDKRVESESFMSRIKVLRSNMSSSLLWRIRA